MTLPPKTRPRRLLICLALSLMSLSLLAWPSASQAQSPFQYLAPRPNAELVSAKTTLALRHGEAISSTSLSQTLFVVQGADSGWHSGRTLLADDGLTIIFEPDQPFTPGEVVSVTINSGLQVGTGSLLPGYSYSFTVSPNPLETYAQPTRSLSDYPQAPNPASRQSTPFSQTFESYATLPPDFPGITVTVPASDTGAGYLFLSNFTRRPSNPYLLMLDNQAEPVYYRQMMPGFRYQDFTVQDNGWLTYFDHEIGLYVALDQRYRITRTYQAGNGYAIDHHGLQVRADDHVLLQIYDNQPVDMRPLVPSGSPTATVVGAVVQELDPSGNVIFEWRSWDHIPITSASNGVDLTGDFLDVTHINSVEWDSDGHILISNRHLDEVTKINRHTAEVIWRMGGKDNEFTFINEPKRLLDPALNATYFLPFSHQHDARRQANGNLTLYDNGNSFAQQYSRAVEYEVNEATRTVTKVWEYRNQPEDIYAFATGNAQRLPNGNTVIAWGGVGLGEPLPALTEVRPDGSKAFELYFRDGASSYRAFRHEWHGQPFEPPALAISDPLQASPVITLHASWNGATDLIGYEIYAGADLPPRQKLQNVVRKGFETTIPLTPPITIGGCYFYQVRPVQSTGPQSIGSNLVYAGDNLCPEVGLLRAEQSLHHIFTASDASLPAKTSVTIPANSTDSNNEETQYLLQRAWQNTGYPMPAPSEARFTGQAFHLELLKHGNPQPRLAFTRPVTVALTLQDDLGFTPGRLDIRRWDSHTQHWLTDSLRLLTSDPLAGQLSFTTTRLGLFAVFGQVEEPTALTVLQDGSFEAGPDNSAWTVESSNLPTVICDRFCSYDQLPQARTGEYWVFFGGGLSQTETASVSQEFLVPAHRELLTATLRFWLKMPEAASNSNDSLRLVLNGSPLVTVTASAVQSYSEYAALSFDVTDVLAQVSPDTAQTLRFEAEIGANNLTSFFVDDVSLTLEGFFNPTSVDSTVYLPLILRGDSAGKKSLGE